ncbi:MAG: hypothetical protein H0T51_13095, partial [Pirellulales bacterium]|nr:hypothetical protein [Pirellulales bacterium]
MDDFNRLSALTDAADTCNANARAFIEHFGDEPEFSRFLTASGQPYCQPAASDQAGQRIDQAWAEAERLAGYVRRWDQASGSLGCIAAAVGIKLPVIEFNGATYQTAHEAARHFAEAVVSTLRSVE